MKQRTRGFASLLIIGLAAVAVLGYLGYRYEQQANLGGTSIQTQLSDTIGTFRTNTNANFTTIDSEIASITSTQATYGTMALVNSPCGIANGCIGITVTPSNAQFLSASGTTPAWKTLIFGGGILTTTTATSVTINTTGLDPTQSYAWTGNNTHSGSETYSSSTVFATSSTLTDNGTATFTASTTIKKLILPNTTSSPLATDANGNIIVGTSQPTSVYYFSTSTIYVNETSSYQGATTTNPTLQRTITLPAGFPTGQVQVSWTMGNTSGFSGLVDAQIYLNGVAQGSPQTIAGPTSSAGATQTISSTTAGSQIQLYLWEGTSGNTGSASNLQLLGTTNPAKFAPTFN